ncbi:hypothetical protein BO71DRAFT_405634 [Aspergillus ellipticus CBS 707.79]|uniref:Uncharacterized protein n=1 Tax=Aspergillus ellipticus CBS 707.79 TaxID=1448320 RepID=A0A319DND9_9EURO|nr:hypothetical protein BO71DRAFT_405634 [Aspergillus ellipticus CBS 707.79]
MDSSAFHARGPEVSRTRQFLNFLGCILVLPLYYFLTAYTRHPLTLDILVTIFAAEYNRYTNENRRRKLYGRDKTLLDAEKAILRLSSSDPGPDCMAAVVGYREDPELWARALESYNSAEGCRFVLTGIDGNEEADMEMVRVFQKVRWSRAGHIESFQNPHIYTLNSPLFFWAAIKREIGPLLGLFYILYYYVTGTSMAYFSWTDLFLRVLYTIIYNVSRNPDRGSQSFGWVLPAMIFYNVPLPMVHAWSLATVFEGGWGTAMRAQGEAQGPGPGPGLSGAVKGGNPASKRAREGRMRKRMRELGFFVVWMGVVGGVVGRIATGLLGGGPEMAVRALGWGSVVFFGVTFYGLVVRE